MSSPIIEDPGEGTSRMNIPIDNASVKSYRNFEYSPFKNFKRISPSFTAEGSKKRVLRKKLPAAISGEQYIRYKRNLMESKEKAEKEKEDRKRKRLENQKEKDEKTRKKKTNKRSTQEELTETESENEDNIEYASSGEDMDGISTVSETDEEVEKCSSCKHLSGSTKWIMCSNCSKWYHRIYPCVARVFSKMNNLQASKCDFKCKQCL